MANFSKFHKYQTFGLIELHNVSKGQLAAEYSSYGKALFTITGLPNIQLLKLLLFNFGLPTFKQILLRML